ncbi:hypothetical protein PIB30_081390 [Stylosanthes scabra]|uniref:Uncharacterized protein n=1 Tax=Stylosanthes scabra TaxID=79078 RepID=A0ABU6WUG8_9FABA|nr:hypothetical protein [Stylosanthes scabra]
MNIDSEESEEYLTHPLVGKVNPLAFVNSFTHFDHVEQANSNDFWSRILTAQRLPVGLLGESTIALRKKVVSYSPQLVARQFGLAQALPSLVSTDAREQLIRYEVSNVHDLERILDKNHAKMESQFNCKSLPEITKCYLCTPSFPSWWSKYFSTQVAHIDSDFSHMILLAETTSSRAKTQGKSLKAVEGTAPGSKKRNIKGLSKGSSSSHPASNPSKKLKTIFVNTKTSPIDAIEEGQEGEIEANQPSSKQVDKTPLNKSGSFQKQPRDTSLSALVLSESMNLKFDLNHILLVAKQIYSSGGKVAPPSCEAQSPLEAVVEPGVVDTLSLTPLPLATIVAKVLVLVADDACKSEFFNIITSLQSQLPSTESKLGQLIEDFISKVYSADISSLESRKQELDSMVNGLNVLQQTSAKYAEAVSRITPILEQGKESEQTMMLKIKALENELSEARTGLANIRATNNNLSEKLEHFEQAKDSNVSATLAAESDLKEAKEVCVAIEQEVEKLTKQQARLKLFLQRLI